MWFPRVEKITFDEDACKVRSAQFPILLLLSECFSKRLLMLLAIWLLYEKINIAPLFSLSLIWPPCWPPCDEWRLDWQVGVVNHPHPIPLQASPPPAAYSGQTMCNKVTLYLPLSPHISKNFLLIAIPIFCNLLGYCIMVISYIAHVCVQVKLKLLNSTTVYNTYNITESLIPQICVVHFLWSPKEADGRKLSIAICKKTVCCCFSLNCTV